MNPALSDNDNLSNLRKSWVKCSLCGYDFKEQVAQRACKSCPMMKDCKLIKCPNCGFETPPEPKWIKYLKRKEAKND